MIILTKTANALLDTMSISELTIVRTDSGHIALVGRECGKPVMEFSSMPISKKLTVEERRILMEDYLEPVITKNKTALQTLIKESTDKTLKDAVDDCVDKWSKKGIELILNKNHPYTYNGNETFTGLKAEVEVDCSKTVIVWNRKDNNYMLSISVEDKQTPSELTVEATSKAKTTGTIILALTEFKTALENLEAQQASIKTHQESLAAKCSL